LSDLDDPDHDFSAHIDADLGFHLLLCQLTGNSVLVEAIDEGDAEQAVKILQDHMMLAVDRLASPAGSR
jgi:DNA-binding FadR family transcriptional regulator